MIEFLIIFIIAVESCGKDSAVGDSGKAIGCMQIHKIVIDDVNRVYKAGFKYSDRLSRKKSIEIYKLYISYWIKKRNLKFTAKNICRIWNGGPNGYKRDSTIKYWHKVRKEMLK